MSASVSRPKRRDMMPLPVVDDDMEEGVVYHDDYHDDPTEAHSSSNGRNLNFKAPASRPPAASNGNGHVHGTRLAGEYENDELYDFDRVPWTDTVKYYVFGCCPRQTRPYRVICWFCVALAIVTAIWVSMVDSGAGDVIKDEIKHFKTEMHNRTRHHHKHPRIHKRGKFKHPLDPKAHSTKIVDNPGMQTTDPKNNKVTDLAKVTEKEVDRVAGFMEMLTNDCPCNDASHRRDPGQTYMECVDDATDLYQKMGFMTADEKADFLKIANVSHCDSSAAGQNTNPAQQQTTEQEEAKEIADMQEFKELIMFVEESCPCMGPMDEETHHQTMWKSRTDFVQCSWKKASDFFGDIANVDHTERNQAVSAMLRNGCGQPTTTSVPSNAAQGDDGLDDDDDYGDYDDDEYKEDPEFDAAVDKYAEALEIECPCMGPSKGVNWDGEGAYMKCLMDGIQKSREKKETSEGVLTKVGRLGLDSECGKPSVTEQVKELLPQFELKCPCASPMWKSTEDYWNCMLNNAKNIWDEGQYHEDSHILEEVMRVAYGSTCGTKDATPGAAGTNYTPTPDKPSPSDSTNTLDALTPKQSETDEFTELIDYVEDACPCMGPKNDTALHQEAWGSRSEYVQCAWKEAGGWFGVAGKKFVDVGERDRAIDIMLKSDCGNKPPPEEKIKTNTTKKNDDDKNQTAEEDMAYQLEVNRLTELMEKTCPCLGPKKDMDWFREDDYIQCMNDELTPLKQNNGGSEEAWLQVMQFGVDSECGTPSIAAQVKALLPQFETVCPCTSGKFAVQKDYWNCMSDASLQFWSEGTISDSHILEEVMRVAYGTSCGSTDATQGQTLTVAPTTLAPTSVPTRTPTLNPTPNPTLAPIVVPKTPDPTLAPIVAPKTAADALDPSKDLAGWFQFMCPCDGPQDGTGKRLKDWTDHRDYIDCVSKASLDARELPKNLNVDDGEISTFSFSAVHSTCGGVPDDVPDGSWEQMKKVCPCEGAVGGSTPWNDHEEYLECMEQALMDLAVSNPNLSNTVVGTDLAKATFDDCGNTPAPVANTKLSFPELRQHFEKDCPCTDGPFSNHAEYLQCMEKATTTWVDSSMMEASLRPAILDVAKSSGCGNPIDADPPADAHAEEPHY